MGATARKVAESDLAWDGIIDELERAYEYALQHFRDKQNWYEFCDAIEKVELIEIRRHKGVSEYGSKGVKVQNPDLV